MKKKNNYVYDNSEAWKKTGYPGRIFLIIVLFMAFILNSCEEKPTEDHISALPLKEGIQLTVPSNLADSVIVDPVLSVTFKQGTDSTIIASTTIVLKNGATPVPGTVTYTATTASFISANDLSPESEYTATIKAGIRVSSDLRESDEYTWKFRTGNHHSYNSVSVVSVTPLNNATDVPANTMPVITFNTIINTMMKSHIKVSLKNGISDVGGTLTFMDKTATFHPAAKLEAGTVYIGKVTIGSGSDDDKSGKNFIWSFKTVGSSVDVSAPTISSVVPTNNSTSVATTSGLSVTFSEAVNNATLTSSTFTLKQGTNSVAGTISSTGSTAKFTPSLPLEADKVYTATIFTGVKDIAGNALAANYTWSFTTTAGTDKTAPTILSVMPLNAATTAAITVKPAVTFSEPMNPATINSTSYTLKQGAAAIAGTVSYAGSTATFSPSASLTANTVYTCTITMAAKDPSGNALAVNYTWSFTTAAASDVTAPTVSSMTPTANATSVAVSSKPTVTFSEAMTVASISTSTITLKAGSASVTGTVSLSGTTATFTPSSALTTGTLYTATITTGVKDASGNALAAPYTWNFTTAAPSDVTAPTVSGVTPSANATSIAVSTKPNVSFSEAMNSSTISSSTFTLKQGSTSISGSVTYSGTTATFTPSSVLNENTVYTCTITTGAKDLAGNAIASSYSWSFTTVVPVVTGKSFSADVMPILNICNTCHTHPWTTSSNASTFYSNLVSSGYVNPTTPTSGKIYTKLMGGHPGSTVTTAQVNTILTWTTEGAKNN